MACQRCKPVKFMPLSAKSFVMKPVAGRRNSVHDYRLHAVIQDANAQDGWQVSVG